MSNKKTKNKKKSHSNTSYLSKGVLDVTRSGMGFVTMENKEQDVLVRPNDFNTALHGDTVRVEIMNTPSKTGRMQGRITEVVERKQTEFLGKIELSASFAFFVAETEKPMPDIFIPIAKLNGAKNNDRVIVKITQWEKNKKPQGEVIENNQPQTTNGHLFTKNEKTVVP